MELMELMVFGEQVKMERYIGLEDTQEEDKRKYMVIEKKCLMLKKIVLCLFVIGSSLQACDRSLEELKGHLLRFYYISMEIHG